MSFIEKCADRLYIRITFPGTSDTWIDDAMPDLDISIFPVHSEHTDRCQLEDCRRIVSHRNPHKEKDSGNYHHPSAP